MSAFAMTFLEVSIVLSIVYIRGTFNRNLSCLSETHYLGHPFTPWCIITALTLFPAWLERSPDGCEFLAFLSCVSMIGVGAFPRYLDKDRKQHKALAYASVLLSVAWIAVFGQWICLAVFPLLSVALRTVNAHWLWCFEVAGLMTMYLAIAL